MAKLPKYLSEKESTKKKGKRGEDKVKNTINSGALFFDKGDLKTKDCLIEVKTTEKKSFRITTKLIEKIVEEAYSVKKEPVICIVFPDYTLHIRVDVHIRKHK